MPTIALQAHFDGEHIVLDEKFDLLANAPLIVTVLPSPSPVAEPDSEAAWLRAVSSSDVFAVLSDPAEDIYTLADGEPFGHAL